MVKRNLAKVETAGSSPVVRSIRKLPEGSFFPYPTANPGVILNSSRPKSELESSSVEKTFDHNVNVLLKRDNRCERLGEVPPKQATMPGRAERTEVKQMNENSDIIFVPDDSASHEWTERDSELVEEYAAQLMSMSI